MATAVFESLSVDPATFERLTGWSMRPEGLCRGERCVPLAAENGRVDVRVFAQRTSSALVHDAENRAMGARTGVGWPRARVRERAGTRAAACRWDSLPAVVVARH